MCDSRRGNAHADVPNHHANSDQCDKERNAFHVRTIPSTAPLPMKSFMDFFQVLIRYVGVYLCGRDVGVAEESLHRSKIGAVFEKVGCKRMSDYVRRDLACDASFDRVAFDQAFDRAGSECVT